MNAPLIGRETSVRGLHSTGYTVKECCCRLSTNICTPEELRTGIDTQIQGLTYGFVIISGARGGPFYAQDWGLRSTCVLIFTCGICRASFFWTITRVFVVLGVRGDSECVKQASYTWPGERKTTTVRAGERPMYSWRSAMTRRMFARPSCRLVHLLPLGHRRFGKLRTTERSRHATYFIFSSSHDVHVPHFYNHSVHIRSKSS